MLHLRVVNLLQELSRNLAGAEDGVREPSIFCIGDSFMVNHVFKWEVLEKLDRAFSL